MAIASWSGLQLTKVWSWVDNLEAIDPLSADPEASS